MFETWSRCRIFVYRLANLILALPYRVGWKSVMVSSLCQKDASVGYFVHKAVFLGNPPRPDSASQVAQRFWFSYANKRISSDRLYQFQNLAGGFMICGYPIGKILQKIPVNDDFPIPLTHEAQHSMRVPRQSFSPLPLLHNAGGLRGVCGHFPASAGDALSPASLPTRPRGAEPRIHFLSC